jgi:hypothetical protein
MHKYFINYKQNFSYTLATVLFKGVLLFLGGYINRQSHRSLQISLSDRLMIKQHYVEPRLMTKHGFYRNS